MKRFFYSMVLTVLSTMLVFSGTYDISKYAVGRVRFVEGNSAKLSFREKDAKVQLDYLVLLGGIFETKKGKLEVVDRNNDVFWFDSDTTFHFEEFDPEGSRTTLFLGKGVFACKTNKPFSIITGAGSIMFPANGRYIVEKPEFGKTKTTITVLEGKKPALIKKSGLFSKFEFKNKVDNSKIYSWMQKRQEDWRKTLVRARLFSNVSIMSPYIADTKDDGKVSWIKVSYMKPYYTADMMVKGNAFYYYNEDLLRASGIAPALVSKFTDDEIRLWFVTNKFNAIKWAWNVERGWHAEFYYEPLMDVMGAEYRFALSGEIYDMYVRRTPWMLDKLTLNPDYYSYLPVRAHESVSYSIINPAVKPTVVRSVVKPIHTPVKVVKPLAIKNRMNTDRTLVSIKTADKLTITDLDYNRTTAYLEQEGGRSGVRPVRSGFASVKPVRTYYSSRVVSKVSTRTRTVTTTKK